MYNYRENITTNDEIKNILVADIVLTIAFYIAIEGGIINISGVIRHIYFLPIVFVAVSLTFILHELMHKFVAQHYGAFAAFLYSNNGLIISLVSGLIGFLMGVPGATYIFSRLSRKEEGVVSIAGPLTNFAIFIITFIIASIMPSGSIIGEAASFIAVISLIIAFFNMLPIYPLDGSKVLRWNSLVYLATMAVLFISMSLVLGYVATIQYLIFASIIALIFSFGSRSIFTV
ncbi:MAG: site-2 protease family protein [Candidatus Micrarchaeota archaeon]|nr:MAG: site-2 protease family protein [Candidatus Micrarchaeota archaeon]